MTAGAIAARFDITRPAVSRHLRVLRECGLVVDAVLGRQRLYRLDATAVEPLALWIAELCAEPTSIDEKWSAAFDALETEVYRTRRERRARPPLPRERSA